MLCLSKYTFVVTFYHCNSFSSLLCINWKKGWVQAGTAGGRRVIVYHHMLSVTPCSTGENLIYNWHVGCLRTICGSIRWLVAPEFCHRKGSPQDLRHLRSSHGNIYSAARWLQHDPVSQSRSTCCVAPANPYHNISPAGQGAAGHSILLQENRSLITHMIPVTPQRGKRVTDQCTWLLFPI